MILTFKRLRQEGYELLRPCFKERKKKVKNKSYAVS